MKPMKIARQVCRQLYGKPPMTASQLWRLMPDDPFAAIGYDSKGATTLMATAFRELEEQGFVIGEKQGRGKFDPVQWSWVGPAPDEDGAPKGDTEKEIPMPLTHVVSKERIATEEELMEESAKHRRAHINPVSDDVIAADLSALANVIAVLDPEPEPDREETALDRSRTMLDDSDPLDAALLRVRELASIHVVDRREDKLAVLARLAEITAPDISDLLLDIGADIS